MTVRGSGLLLGLLLFAAMLALPAPDGLSIDGWRTAAVAVLVACWWMTEALPLSMTALLPFLLLPPLGVADAKTVAAGYYAPVLMLVLGGALIAIAIEKTGLHRRVALAVVARSPASLRALVFAFMAATAIISMFVSNTATALIMIPITMSVVLALDSDAQVRAESFAPAVILGVAYAASIGGLGTLVGSPTNAIAAGLIEKSLGWRVDFATWASFGLPLVVLSLPLCWFALVAGFGVPHRALDRQSVARALGDVGDWTKGERRLLPLIGIVSLLWITLPFLKDRLGPLALDDGAVAVGAGLLLFLLRGDGGRAILARDDLDRVPWAVILLFGGGLALAEAITASGLALWIGEQLEVAGGLPVWVVALLLTALIVVVTEFASNVAAASGFMPVVGGLVLATGIDAPLLAIPAAMAASWGFMLPAATPPNAIAFATGRVSVRQMIRAGFVVDLIGIVMIVAVTFAVARLS